MRHSIKRGSSIAFDWAVGLLAMYGGFELAGDIWSLIW